jgi:hypothetical protein
MKRREEIEQLLGGYAAGTLTPSERKLLFDAAMEDQDLFNKLAEEESLKELLDDPDSRAYLRDAIGETLPPPEKDKKKQSAWSAWWWPAAGLSAVAAGLALVTVVGIQKTTERSSTAATEVAVAKDQAPKVEMAKNEPAPAPPPAPAAAGNSKPLLDEVAKQKSRQPASGAGAAGPSTAIPSSAPEQAKPAKVIVADSADRKELEKKGEDRGERDKDARPVTPVAPKPVVAAPPADARQEVTVMAESRPPAPPQPSAVGGSLSGRSQQPAAPAPAAQQQAAGLGQQSATPQEARQQQAANAAMQQTASQLYQAQFRQNQSAAIGQLSAFSGSTETARARRDTAATATRKAAPAASAPGSAVQKEESPREAGVTSAAGAVQNAGIRYQVLRKNSQGQFLQTRIDTRFEAGDEIILAVDKNAGGIVNIVQRRPQTNSTWTSVPITTQNGEFARSAPIRLEKGPLTLLIVLTRNGLANTTQPPPATPGQLTEAAGLAMYVVLPGVSTAPLATEIRLNVQ